MFFRQIVHSDLGCASYFVASSESGEAVVVDPRLEIDPYLQIASDNGFQVVMIIETHNHADHVSGHSRLAAATGAEIAVHEEAGVEFPHRGLADGEILTFGDVRLHVIHTPGHRPEHIALGLEDVSRGSDLWVVLTGDTLFVGDVARPDLAVDGMIGAQTLFDSLHEKLLRLPDFAMAYPAHVAGSLCGRVSSDVGSTTIGYERRYNPALQIPDRAEFVRHMNERLPQRPPNMQTIVARNQGPLTLETSEPEELSAEQVSEMIADGAIVLDVRPTDRYLQSHILGSVHVPLSGPQFGTRAGFVLPQEASVLVIATDVSEARRAVESLRVVALDQIAGYAQFREWEDAGRDTSSVARMSIDEISAGLNGRGPIHVIDVREPDEWAEGTVEDAVCIPYRELRERSNEIPNDGLVAVMCQSGGRSAIGVSLLEEAGVKRLANVEGGMAQWMAAGLPTVVPSAVDQVSI